MATKEAPARGGTEEGGEGSETYWPPEIEKQVENGRISAAQADIMSRGSKPPENGTPEAEADEAVSASGQAPEAHGEVGGQLEIPGLPDPPQNPEHN